jgi:hypothetical protein
MDCREFLTEVLCSLTGNICLVEVSMVLGVGHGIHTFTKIRCLPFVVQPMNRRLYEASSTTVPRMKYYSKPTTRESNRTRPARKVDRLAIAAT